MAALGKAIDQKSQVSVDPTSLPDKGEAGILFGDLASGHFILLGVRNTAGTYQVVREVFIDWASQGVVAVATTSAVKHWLRLTSNDSRVPLVVGAGMWKFEAGWSTSGPTSGWSFASNINAARFYQYTGMYARTVGGAIGSTMTIKFDNWQSISGKGQRANEWYVYRDPSLPGTPDLVGAERALRRLRQSYTAAHVCTAKIARCDDANTGCDRTPMGAI